MAVSSLSFNCLSHLSSKANLVAHDYCRSVVSSEIEFSLPRRSIAPVAVAASSVKKQQGDAEIQPRFDCRNKLVALAAATATGISLLSYIEYSAAVIPQISTSYFTPVDVTVAVYVPNDLPSRLGFWVPPPPGKDVGVTDFQAEMCPAWQPSQLEMVVPNEVRPKSFPRQGNQWLALYLGPDAHITDSEEPHPANNAGAKRNLVILSTQNPPKADSSIHSELIIAEPNSDRGHLKSAATIQDLLSILSRQRGFLSCFNL
ncbi:hypothetical protein O6H91_07G029300 [Diphasiastrum complanatum]|uniref:Uncharacterized protein n=1 Tax=Diphasiastrum complanatum TaxID=34168 RepID=A0ACC2D3J8_DIPCM|nr:hypothetical protein O6H91_07G029300 [Diphasiastrum complanatum]